jgi:hypothetical protein
MLKHKRKIIENNEKAQDSPIHTTPSNQLKLYLPLLISKGFCGRNAAGALSPSASSGRFCLESHYHMGQNFGSVAEQMSGCQITAGSFDGAAPCFFRSSANASAICSRPWTSHRNSRFSVVTGWTRLRKARICGRGVGVLVRSRRSNMPQPRR